MVISDTILGAMGGACITTVGGIVVTLIGRRSFLQHAVEKHVATLLDGYQMRLEELTKTYEVRITELTSSYEKRITDLTSEIHALRKDLRTIQQVALKIVPTPALVPMIGLEPDPDSAST